MDTATLIIAGIVILVCALPVVLLNRSGKKNQQEEDKQ